ncbi:hypothetical protein HMPREF1987_01616, partial [Peptostreptococcaceae bacterium oral taxon 113 str. W5053]
SRFLFTSIFPIQFLYVLQLFDLFFYADDSFLLWVSLFLPFFLILINKKQETFDLLFPERLW